MLRSVARASRMLSAETPDLASSLFECSLLPCIPTSSAASTSYRLSGVHTHSEPSTSEPASQTPVRRRRKIVSLLDKLKSHTLPSTEDGTKVVAAAIIERYPIVFPALPTWELDYLEWQKEWNAWKYKHISEDYLNCDKEVDETSEMATFQPEPIETEADREQNIKSLRRNTPGYLYLVVRPQGSKRWIFPQATNGSDETLRDTVERSLHETVGTSIETAVLGNMPCAHVQRDGERVFFMSGLVLDGNVKLKPNGENSRIRDYAWLTKDEILSEYAQDAAMSKMLTTVLAS